VPERTIWKFKFDDNVFIATPPLAEPRVVHVAQQGQSLWPTVWIEHSDRGWWDPDVQRQSVELVIVGTGHPAPPDLRHVGSAICGEFVWHVYGRWVDA